VPRISPRLRAPTHLEPIAEAIESIPTRGQDDTLELCVSVPPRHGKTTLLLHAIAWLLLTDPTITILYASYSHGFASKQARRARALTKKAGVRLGSVARRDEWDTAAGGGVKAVGLGGQITGEGFRVIIVDDPHKRFAEAQSTKIREGVVDGFLSDIYTRQDPAGTSFIVVHTRWHQEDLIGVLSADAAAGEDVDDIGAEEDVRPFRVINLPAVDPSDTKGCLAPWLFTRAKLDRWRARVGAYVWASLFMGSPQSRDEQLFTEAVLVEALDVGAEASDGYRYAIGVDLARTAKTRRDWHVAVVMRMNLRTKWIDVVDVVRSQGALVDDVRGERVRDEGFVKKLHALQRAYPGARSAMYTGFDESAFLALLAGHDRFPCKIEAWPTKGLDKFQRATPYGLAWREGTIRLPRHARWVLRFVREHIGFTGQKGETDDQVDAAAAAFDALMNPGPAPLKSAGRGTGRGSRARRLGSYLCPARATAAASRALRERRVHGSHRHRSRRPPAYSHRGPARAHGPGWQGPAGWACHGAAAAELRAGAP